MALVVCPKCGKSISEKALICPKCGVKLRADSSARLVDEAIRQQEELIRQKEAEFCQKEEEIRRREAEILQRESEILKKENDLCRKENEVQQKKDEALHREDVILESEESDREAEDIERRQDSPAPVKSVKEKGGAKKYVLLFGILSVIAALCIVVFVVWKPFSKEDDTRTAKDDLSSQEQREKAAGNATTAKKTQATTAEATTEKENPTEYIDKAKKNIEQWRSSPTITNRRNALEACNDAVLAEADDGTFLKSFGEELMKYLKEKNAEGKNGEVYSVVIDVVLLLNQANSVTSKYAEQFVQDTVDYLTEKQDYETLMHLYASYNDQVAHRYTEEQQEATYLYAVQILDKGGDYNRAIDIFLDMLEYKDSKSLKDKAYYLEGKRLFDKKAYNKAKTMLARANGYADADQLLQQAGDLERQSKKKGR